MAAIKPNPTLSDYLISKILVRLPVKSLLRFQAVCKTWLSLIKDPAFVKSQLRHATTTETDQTLIISGLARHTELFGTSLLHVDSCKIVANLKFPYPWDQDFCRLVGSANGIVCVSYNNNLESNTKICLWNPAIRQSKVIPLHYDMFGQSLGFGYDSIDNDYKVFRVVWDSSCAEVFSNNKNVWRKLPDAVDLPHKSGFDVFVNGFLVCIGWDGMMSFDLNKEVLNCAIKLPVTTPADYDDDGNYDYFIKYRIIEYNNSIAFIIMPELNDGEKINLWMLDDDACLGSGGVEPSWTPMFSIDLDDWCYNVLQDLRHGFSNGDSLLMILRSDNLWIMCNADKKDAKIVLRAIHKVDHCFGPTVCKYTESLVSIRI